MLIRPAEARDLPAVAALEKTVEDPRLAASLDVLNERHESFPNWFFVALCGDQVVGYLESIRWDAPEFERFDEIKDYPRMHRDEGSVLYIAYMAVAPAFRKRGIAIHLLETAEQRAIGEGLQKLQLVALPKLTGFYRVMGFRWLRTLPDFLDVSAGELMEKPLARVST
jgi:ribosomal protein S18 acetylase RimI-like enzyme